ncbi:transferrin-binding protein-like solute binding protein [Gallibacterium trehalosifermentans]|uniref:Transferrin-binding protein-like solute binding protein n=1 Tax=Gallibacterium trehalosifermentans TaxID=516935 RepID=A0ABV6H2M0_9PAST
MKKRYLSSFIFVSFFLTACASGGGSFDVETVPESKEISGGGNKTSPNYQKTGVNVKADDFTEMGYSVSIPNAHIKTAESFGKLQLIDRNLEKQYFSANTKQIDLNGKSISLEIISDNWKYLQDVLKTSTSKYPLGGKVVIWADSKFTTYLKLFDYDDALAGLIVIRDGGEVLTSIFYQGNEKATEIPISGVFTYTGNWAIGGQINGSDTLHSGQNQGDSVVGGITQTQPISLTVNFDTKEVSGNLSTTQASENVKLSYTLNAKINGNSFTGTASGTYDFGGSNGSGTSKATVSGSFFGEKAKTLAGRINSNGNEFAATFIASRNGSEEVKSDGHLFNTKLLSYVNDNNKVILGEERSSNFSGNINKLQVDGVIFDLISEQVCCAETEFMKYGKYIIPAENGEQTDITKAGFFLQGLQTPISEIPTSGESHYQGKWYGYGYADSTNSNGALFSKSELDAVFTANWDNKSLTGKLFNDNQNINGDGVINITSTINEQGFSGKATITGLAIDTAKDASNTQYINGEANVNGYFYGKDANELGGTIRKTDGSFSAVFGGKQISK